MDKEIIELIKTNTELMKLIIELMYQNNYLLEKNDNTKRYERENS